MVSEARRSESAKPVLGARVLVVEDDPTVREVVERYLEREGIVVDSVGDGLVALEHAAACWPDLVVLDLMLPGLDGLEVCRRLRAQPKSCAYCATCSKTRSGTHPATAVW